MSCRFVIMAHPNRARLAGRVIASLGRDALVSWDPEPGGSPSALRGHLTALEAAAKASPLPARVVLLQDDALPCARFRDLAVQISERPANEELLVSFYAGTGHAVRRDYMQAWRTGQRYCPLPLEHYVPTVALSYPAALAWDFLAWARSLDPVSHPWDDEAVKTWRIQSGVSAVATIPSLVEHDNRAPSIMRHHMHGFRHPIVHWRKARGDLRAGW